MRALTRYLAVLLASSLAISAQTPDPDLTFTPNEVGRSIRFIFSGGEAPDCGGFGELKIHVVR